MRTTRAWALLAGALALTVVGLAPGASADPVEGGSASAFVLEAGLAGTPIVEPTPSVAVSAPPFGDADQTLVPLDAGPLAINGTGSVWASVHEASDLDSEINDPAAQHDVAGPYNARAVSLVEGLEVLDALDGAILDAGVIRAEAVAVCTAGTVQYSATSEVVDLQIAGEDPLSGPLNELIGTIVDALEPLAPVADVDVNVVTVTETGATVDALVITLLGLLDDPLAEVRIGHAEVSGVACGDAGDGGDLPECSDGIDNDGDGLIDIDDPECHTDGDPDNPDSYDPDDDDEGPDGGGDGPGCSDGIDNDGDGLVDIDDPDCHTDGDPDNPDSYDPGRDETGGGCADALDNDGDGLIDAADPDCHTDGDPDNPDSYDPTRQEVSGPAGGGGDGGGQLPSTGSDVATGAAALAALGGLALVALRRRASLG
ncbi:MAG TPA: hypothetical protein VK007_13175 [Acidimicrobiales bacterium]|nr:hypothetical protein [Acidimicrobiales bacterium]